MAQGDYSFKLSLGLAATCAGIAQKHNVSFVQALSWLAREPRYAEDISDPSGKLRSREEVVEVIYHIYRDPQQEITAYGLIEPFFNGSLVPARTWGTGKVYGSKFDYQLTPEGKIVSR